MKVAFYATLENSRGYKIGKLFSFQNNGRVFRYRINLDFLAREIVQK